NCNLCIVAAKDNNKGSLGLAYQSEIYSIKAFNKNGLGTTQDVIRGIKWALEHSVDIINFSIVLNEGSDELHEIIKEAHHKGVLLVGQLEIISKEKVQITFFIQLVIRRLSLWAL